MQCHPRGTAAGAPAGRGDAASGCRVCALPSNVAGPRMPEEVRPRSPRYPEGPRGYPEFRAWDLMLNHRRFRWMSGSTLSRAPCLIAERAKKMVGGEQRRGEEGHGMYVTHAQLVALLARDLQLLAEDGNRILKGGGGHGCGYLRARERGKFALHEVACKGGRKGERERRSGGKEQPFGVAQVRSGEDAGCAEGHRQVHKKPLSTCSTKQQRK
jgi:hypothetical protein